MFASHALLLLLPLRITSAHFTNNINYRSPSTNHEGLGIDIPKVAKRTEPRSPWDPSELSFTHGVASGDPYQDSVILWTRISPQLENDRSNVTVEGSVPLYDHDNEKYVKTSKRPICVDYRVWHSNTSGYVDSGTAYTSSDVDFTIKVRQVSSVNLAQMSQVEAKNLSPFTNYEYQFNVCGSNNTSPTGRTKTLPRPDDEAPIGLAVFSCANYPVGYFNAYGIFSRKDDVDFVIHLGDYFYEREGGVEGERATNPSGDTISLYDYRTRIAQYRTDPDLQRAHLRFPWMTTWDDHEVANDAYRDGFSSMNNTEESFVESGGVSVDQRKMNAVRAYFEWMPIRQVDMDDNLRIWRSFQLGKYADLIILDTRQYDRSITTLGWNDEYIPLIQNDAGRSVMGSHQENWFYNTLSRSSERGATWRIVGNQMIFSRTNLTATSGETFNYDQWDGYSANRNRTLQHLYENEISNNIFLAGDSHANWVSDLVWLDEVDYDPETGTGAIGVEFAGTAVSSLRRGYGDKGYHYANQRSEELIRDNLPLQWAEGYYRGYYELQITRESVQARYFGNPTVAFRSPLQVSVANFTVISGHNRVERPVAGGMVDNGFLRGGERLGTNQTLNLDTGSWNASSFDKMYI